MPFPGPQDVLNDIDMLPDGLRDYYVPNDLGTMIEHWVSLIYLSKILGEVLSLFYQQLGIRPTLSQFDALESELSRFEIPEPRNSNQSSLSMFSHYHLQLHYQ